MQSKSVKRIVAAVTAIAVLVVAVILLLNKLAESQRKLNQSADIIESLGNTSFFINADITDSIDINTSFTIPVSIPVHVLMKISVDAPLNMKVPVKQSMQIPYSISISEILPVDTVFSFPDGLRTTVNDSIAVRTKLKTKFWPGIKVPVNVTGTMPFNQTLSLNPEKLRVSSEIPIRLQLNDSIPVYLDFTVPVTDTLPMELLIDADAIISFYSPLPVNGRLPLKMTTPVEVDFSKTPLKAKFDSLAKVMREIL